MTISLHSLWALDQLEKRSDAKQLNSLEDFILREAKQRGVDFSQYQDMEKNG